jgi:hypothetical protein
MQLRSDAKLIHTNDGHAHFAAVQVRQSRSPRITADAQQNLVPAKKKVVCIESGRIEETTGYGSTRESRCFNREHPAAGRLKFASRERSAGRVSERHNRQEKPAAALGRAGFPRSMR